MELIEYSIVRLINLFPFGARGTIQWLIFFLLQSNETLVGNLKEMGKKNSKLSDCFSFLLSLQLVTFNRVGISLIYIL